MHLGVLTVVLFFLHVHHHVAATPSVIPGYLDFDNLPETNFSCKEKVIGGYYADIETGCQMFHVCTIGQIGEVTDIKFLCLNGTVFDQATRVCERVDEVDCSKAEEYFDLNLELYGNNIFGFGNEEEESEISSNGDLEAQKETTTTPQPTTTTPRPTEPPTTTQKPTTLPPSLHYLSVTTHRPYYNTQIKHNIRLNQQNQNQPRPQPNLPITHLNDYRTISSTLPTYNPSSYSPQSTTSPPKPVTHHHHYSSTQAPRQPPPERDSYENHHDEQHHPDDNSQFEDVDEYTSSGDGDYEEEDEDVEPIVIHKPISVANRFPVTSIGSNNIKVENNGDVNNNRPNGHSTFTESLSLPHGNTNIRFNVNRGNLQHDRNQYGGGYDSTQENTNIHAQHKINTDFILNRQLESERHKYHGGYSNNQGLVNQFSFPTTTPAPTPQYYNRPVQYSTTLQPYLLPPTVRHSTQHPPKSPRQLDLLKRKLQEEIVSSPISNRPFERAINPLFTTPSVAIVSQTSSTSFVSSVSKVTHPSVPTNGTILGISTLASVNGYPTKIVQHNPHNLTLDLLDYGQKITETTPPDSYDEYSESDVTKDPFFKDVPRISVKKNQHGLRAKRGANEHETRVKRGANVLSELLGRERLGLLEEAEEARLRRQSASRELPIVQSYRKGRQRVLNLTPEDISKETFSRPLPGNPDIPSRDSKSYRDSVKTDEDAEIENVQNWKMVSGRRKQASRREPPSLDFIPDSRFTLNANSNPRRQSPTRTSNTVQRRNPEPNITISPSTSSQLSDIINNPDRTYERIEQRNRAQHRAQTVVQTTAQPDAPPTAQIIPQPVTQTNVQPVSDPGLQQPTIQPTELTLEPPRGPVLRTGISSEAFGPMEIRHRQKPTPIRENRQRTPPRVLIAREPIVIPGLVGKNVGRLNGENPENVVRSENYSPRIVDAPVTVNGPRRNLVSAARKRLQEARQVGDAQTRVQTQVVLESQERVTRRPTLRRVVGHRAEPAIQGDESLGIPTVNPPATLQSETLTKPVNSFNGQEQEPREGRSQEVTKDVIDNQDVVQRSPQPPSRRQNGQRKIESRLNANSERSQDTNGASQTNLGPPTNTPRSNQRPTSRNNRTRSKTPNLDAIREELSRSELAVKQVNTRQRSRRPVSDQSGEMADQSVAAQMTDEQLVELEEEEEEGTTRMPLPETSFTCADKVPGGYYADLEADCQLFHICSQGRHGRIKDNKFLCGPGTRFNQQSRTCQTRDLVDCQLSASLYHVNNHFSQPTPAPPGFRSDGRRIHRGKRSTVEALSAALKVLKRDRRQQRETLVYRRPDQASKYYDYEDNTPQLQQQQQQSQQQQQQRPQPTKQATPAKLEPDPVEYYDDYPELEVDNNNKIPTANGEKSIKTVQQHPTQPPQPRHQETPVKQVKTQVVDYYYDYPETVITTRPVLSRNHDNGRNVHVVNNVKTAPTFQTTSTQSPQLNAQEQDPIVEYYDDYPDSIPIEPKHQHHPEQNDRKETIPSPKQPDARKFPEPTTRPSNQGNPVKLQVAPVDDSYQVDTNITPRTSHNSKHLIFDHNIPTPVRRNFDKEVVQQVAPQPTQLGKQEVVVETPADIYYEDDYYADTTLAPKQRVDKYEISTTNKPIITMIELLDTQTTKQAMPVHHEVRPVQQEAKPIVHEIGRVPLEAGPVLQEARPGRLEAGRVSQEARPVPLEDGPVTHEAGPIRLEARPVSQEARPVPLEAGRVSHEAGIVPLDAEPVPQEARPVTLEPIPVQFEAKPVSQKVLPVPQDTIPVPHQDALPVYEYYDDYVDITTVATKPVPKAKIPVPPSPPTTTIPYRTDDKTSVLGQDYYLSKDYVNDNYEPATYNEKPIIDAVKPSSVENEKKNIPIVETKTEIANDAAKQTHLVNDVNTKNNKNEQFTESVKKANLTESEDYYYYDEEVTTPLIKKSTTTERPYVPRINIDDIYFTTTYEELLARNEATGTDSSPTEYYSDFVTTQLEYNGPGSGAIAIKGHKEEGLIAGKITTKGHVEDDLVDDKMSTKGYIKDELEVDKIIIKGLKLTSKGHFITLSPFIEEESEGDKMTTKGHRGDVLEGDKITTQGHREDGLEGDKMTTQRHRENGLAGDKMTTKGHIEEEFEGAEMTTKRHRADILEVDKMTTTAEQGALYKLRDAVYTFLEMKDTPDDATVSVDSNSVLTTLNSIPQTTQINDITTEKPLEDVTVITEKSTTVKSRRIHNRYKNRISTSTLKPRTFTTLSRNNERTKTRRTTTEKALSSTLPTTIGLYERSKTRRVVQSRHQTPGLPGVQIRTAGSMTRKPPPKRVRTQITPMEESTTEAIQDTTESIVSKTSANGDVSDLPVEQLENKVGNGVTLASPSEPLTTILSEVSQYATESSVTTKYTQPIVTSNDNEQSLTQELPKDNRDSFDEADPATTSKGNVKFNCHGKELNTYYPDNRDPRMIHYCSLGFNKKQILDFRFVCDHGTTFNALLRKCE